MPLWVCLGVCLRVLTTENSTEKEHLKKLFSSHCRFSLILKLMFPSYGVLLIQKEDRVKSWVPREAADKKARVRSLFSFHLVPCGDFTPPIDAG